MVPEVLEGMLWLARLGLRCQVGTVRAGHGYADPGFRPPSLPFVSLVGPLGIEVEPEPEPDVPAALDAIVQLPGFVRGTPRSGQTVSAGATLAVSFEGDAAAQITLDAGNFGSVASAAAVCTDIENKLRVAASTGAFRSPADAVIDDPLRMSELEAISCRWDPVTSTVVLSSGRCGYVMSVAPSMVEVTGGTAAPALGFSVPARGEPGRHVQQHPPAPKSLAIDVRLDLWAGSQRDLGYLIDALVRSIPTRSRLVTRAALLAAEVAPGDTSVRLLAEGEPTIGESWLHLEATDGLTDRVSEAVLEVSSPANVQLLPQSLFFSGNGVARKVLARSPVVPVPRCAVVLAPSGVAITLGLRLVLALAGHSGRLVSLQSGGQDVLALDYAIVDVDPGARSSLAVLLTAKALFRGAGAVSGTAQVTRRVPLSVASDGVAVHVVAQSGSGVVAIALDSTAQDYADATQTPSPPVAVPGTFATADDLSVTLGNPAGNPAPFELDHVHLYAAPLPALDPRLRASAHGAGQFVPGDRIALGASERGLLPVGATESFWVRSVSGDTVELDRPVAQRWCRRSMAYARDYVVQEREVKRRDDLMNRLYRYCVGYRVSTFVERAEPISAGELESEAVVDVDARPARPAASGSGVRTRVLAEPVTVAGPASTAVDSV
jgi:hypothetical protein